jgi:hypothetical protein
LGPQVSLDPVANLTQVDIVCSMLVDPTGKVQTELDETEGIAFGQVGRRYLHSLGTMTDILV